MITYPPGPKGLPFFGKSISYLRDPLGFASSLAQTYGPIASYRFLRWRAVFATRAEAVRYVLIENASNFTNREVYVGLRPLMGNGLFTIDGAFHKQQRQLVQPAFHRRRVETYSDLLIACTSETLDGWRVGQSLDIDREMLQLMIKTVGKALFNVDVGRESNPLAEVTSAALEYLDHAAVFSVRSAPINLPFTLYGRFIRSLDRADAALDRMIEHRRKSNQDCGDVLSMLLRARDENAEVMTDEQVRDQIRTLFAAGFETTSSALSWTLYLLSEHPPVQRKLAAEIVGVVADRPPTAADLEHMPYLEMVVKESMRLYPPAWFVLRRAVDDFELEGYHLPGGTVVVLCQYVTHRLPLYWTQPERFWPERFNPENGEPRDPFAYFPFGAGPRSCIGMSFAMLQARLVLAMMLQRFTPRLAPGARVEPQAALGTLRPRYGVPMILDRAAYPEARMVSAHAG